MPDALRVGFTGSRYVDRLHYATIDEVLARYLDAQEYTTGGAVGVDTYVLRKLSAWCPEAKHRVCLPEHGPDWDNPYLELATEVIYVPNTEKHEHRSRNKAILDFSDLLIAMPLHPEDNPQSKRSGSWMTIRMARQRGIPVDLTVLGW
jgi:hypothetical protein